MGESEIFAELKEQEQKIEIVAKSINDINLKLKDIEQFCVAKSSEVAANLMTEIKEAKSEMEAYSDKTMAQCPLKERLNSIGREINGLRTEMNKEVSNIKTEFTRIESVITNERNERDRRNFTIVMAIITSIINIAIFALNFFKGG